MVEWLVEQARCRYFPSGSPKARKSQNYAGVDSETTLSGPLADQAALFGVLTKNSCAQPNLDPVLWVGKLLHEAVQQLSLFVVIQS